MTYLEKAIKDNKKEIIQAFIENHCPKKISDKYIDMDESSLICENDYLQSDIKGCRGITCEECWNQQVSK